jgi:hypothetical protein
MRAILVSVGVVAASQLLAQTTKIVSLAQLEAQRPALAGETVTVQNVTIFGFSQYHGGLVRDASGGAKLDDAGMTPRTIYHLERHCSRVSTSAPKAECQGSLTFKVTLREEHRGGFTIKAAEFTPK